ncbi:alpha/beta hydrolase [Pantanalinema sp. GBBB05]|uniref:alpha/beta hydrolase n=1 Tax=Pantanalinema sp. GBBB05 TaxID=2604139 RepID=UPI001DDDD50C|nr:alpha/beta hydrolase [Pantanalinema sp. GBBB05]
MMMPHSSRYRLLSCAIGFGIIIQALPVFAAEQVMLKFGMLRQAIAVTELSNFAQTGQVPSSLQAYMKLAKKRPEEVRQALTRTVKLNAVALDQLLKSPTGGAVLDQVGEAVYSSTSRNNRVALRTALVQSASNDGQLSLLEAIQNYPTAQVQVESSRVVNAYRQLSQLEKQIRART